MQEETSSLCETLCGGVEDGGRSKAKGKLPNSPLLVMDPKRLSELLQICTSIARGELYSCFLAMHFNDLVTVACGRATIFNKARV